MKKVMSMTEVLAKLKTAKNALDKEYNKFSVSDRVPFSSIDSSILLIDVINRSKGSTAAGHPADQAESNVQANWDRLASAQSIVKKLTAIKDGVNHEVKITIPNPDYTKQGTVTVPMSEVLALTNSSIKYMYSRILAGMQTQYESATRYMREFNERVLSNERINGYINDKLNEEGIEGKDDSTKRYLELYNEFVSMNKIEFVDPVNLKSKIEYLSNWIDTFYTDIDYKLSEKNATIKIEVDLDKDDDFWHIVEG